MLLVAILFQNQEKIRKNKIVKERMIFVEDIIVDYNLDGSITVDYIGSVQ